MSFSRQSSTRWHEEVPGSRWFRTDLHVHTVDDLPGGQVKVPEGVQGDLKDPKTLREYAKVFLRGAIRAGVQVLGLTPHTVKAGDGPETSAVWQIVDVWNTEDDEDGTPFREKIYAVFPGFEPNLNDGGSGVHLLFLFDPEIGRDRYLALFDAVMDGRAPWDNGDLKLTQRSVEEVCKTIDERQKESRTSPLAWDYLVLAPHFQNHHGLLREVKRQVLKTFPCHRLAGYELGDDKLPEDFDKDTKPGSFLLSFMEEHRQALFHASDAYKIAAGSDPGEHELGYRTTWFKLASPRIEALRQAFIASESRLQIAYQRDGNALTALSKPPDPLNGVRPWLRRVTVCGEAAFFGGRDASGPRTITVDLSPELTCIIGGSMTGKSALLDGLRVYIDAEPPSENRLREDVEARGRQRFLAGQPEVTLDTPGHVTGTPNERWPAVFFSQNELQRLAQDPGAVEDILARLVADEQSSILDRNRRLAELDSALARQARRIGELLDQRAEAEQQLSAAGEAEKALKAFQEAGLAQMQTTDRLHGEVHRAEKRGAEVQQQVAALRTAVQEAGMDPKAEAEILARVESMESAPNTEGLGDLHARALGAVEQTAKAVQAWATELKRVRGLLQRAAASDRQAVERKLAEMGHGAEKLAEFQVLSRRAGMLSSYKAAFDDLEAKLKIAREALGRDIGERDGLVAEQRDTYGRVKETVEHQFDGRIRVGRIDNGRSISLEQFLLGLNQRGITRWWNGLEERQRPSPQQLDAAMQASTLAALGVSDTVAERFGEALTEAKRFELRALRSPDQYVLELRVSKDEYRRADQLSGGKRVSLLLSLLLEAHDDRPLVIDQPEDELDNRFLWETVLPALRRLKGRRQVIVATHNANIVVNGDADLVVQLEADAEHGRVAVSGAIEDPEVRRAIVETVDGGEKAFELRQAKYGF